MHPQLRPIKSSAAALASLGLLVACRSVPLEPVIVGELFWAGDGTPTAAIDEAIWRAGRKAGWQVERVRPAELRGTWRIKQHTAVVMITHDGQRVSIAYVDSENLLYDDGHIHRNYPRLVEQLLDQIRREPITPVPP